MTALRGVTTQWTSGDTSADVVTPTCQAGDHLVIFVGGGNKVTNVPAGWISEFYFIGQEAQGIIYHRDAAGVETGTLVTVGFDGGDPRYIVAIAVTDWESWIVSAHARAGTAGVTLPPTTVGWTADQYQGDLLLTFAFCRNAGLPPTMDRGTLWESHTENGSSGAIYIESLPAYSEGEPFALNLPERSGHVYYSLPIWGLTVSDWIQGPDFEVLTESLGGDTVSDTRSHGGSAVEVGAYPTITQGTFLDDQPLQVFGSDDPNPAGWSHDRFEDTFTNEFSRTWSTFRTHWLYASSLSTASLNEPINDTFPPDAVGAAQWEAGTSTAGSRAVAARTLAHVNDVAEDATTGTPQDLAGGEFTTPLYPATGVTWTSPLGWDRSLGDLTHPLHLHPGALVDPHTPTVVDDLDLSAALDPAPGLARLAVTFYVAGLGGTGDPILDLRSYTFHGTAYFGATYSFPSIASGGGLYWTIRPGRRRHTLRRGPIVDIRPVVAFVSVVRQFPRDDEFGQGAGPRIFPPPRRSRVFGGYQ